MEYLTVEEFAKQIKMSTHSIRKSIREGRIFAFRPSVGKKAPYRIAESELERLQLQAMYEKKNKE